MPVAKAFASLRICADLQKYLLLADAIPKSRALVHFVLYPLDIKKVPNIGCNNYMIV